MRIDTAFALTLALWSISVIGAHADILISEVLADNENGLRDEDGDRQDWIELYNSGDQTVSLEGWWLTDKPAAPALWRIPAAELAPNATLLIWASGKNRTDPARPLHTSFSLAKGGEYLGLFRPDPVTGTPLQADAFAPAFPALPPDVSYGKLFGPTFHTFIAAGETGRYRVLTDAENDAVYRGTDYAAGHLGHDHAAGWNVSAAFDDTSWTRAATGIGYDTSGAFTYLLGVSPPGDCKQALRLTNTSLCFRRTFVVPDPSRCSAFILRMKFEDGFVAFVNGVEVGRATCTNILLSYNTAASGYCAETNITAWMEVPLPYDLITAGTNLLAVQGLNASRTSSDFLLLPELHATAPAWNGTTGFFSAPTPGAVNGAGTAGPLLFNAAPEDPNVPRPLGTPASPPLTVTVRALPTLHAVRAVRVIPRVMFQPELASVAMTDDGIAPDTAAGDGVYAAQLQTAALMAGQMLRWRFEVEDEVGTVTRLPAFSDPLDAPQYFGTVATDPATATSQLPVLEWFVQNAPTYGPTTGPFRGCCYALSNFYDNVGHMIHGQTTSTFPKRSYDFDFTGEDRFLWRAGERRVKDINLLTNYADKTKARNHLSHWMAQMSGTPHHFVVPVRVQLNGTFHGVMDLVEDSDDRMLERNGLDPAGAFYKIYGTTVAQAEKKTRKTEDKADIAALYAGLSRSLPLDARLTYTYDNVDVAATINYRVTRLLNGDADIGEKNDCLYRDTNGTRDWQPIMWDVDLTHGHNWSDTLGYFDDALTSNILFNAGGLKALLYDIVYYGPEFQQMFVRRLRTLMDRVLQAPGTVDGLMEQQFRAIAASIDPDPADPSPWTDGDLDAARWGFHANYAPNRPRAEVERVIAGYLAPRRAFLFNAGANRPTYNGVPFPDAPQVNAAGMIVIDTLDSLPASGTQAHEYVILRNTSALAVDLSGWRIEGAINHTFAPGTVIPAGTGSAAAHYVGLLHLVKDAVAFRTRSTGPSGGQRRFVQGNYAGQLSARGGTLTLLDDAGLTIHTLTYTGTPIDTQQHLRLSEINYHPADPTLDEARDLIGVTAEDFEYIELVNLGLQSLQLAGAWFSQGIGFTFPDTALAPSQRVIIAKQPAAFNRRYPAVDALVRGPYDGFLDNAGERLELNDACGEVIFGFTYKDGWYPHTDGTGRSLVVREPSAPQDGMLSDPATWGISAESLGAPGTAEKAHASAYYGWDNLHFSSEQRADAALAGPFADPDGDGRLNWVEYALGCDPWAPDDATLGLGFLSIDEQRHAALTFIRPVNALDLRVELVATHDLRWELWSTADSAQHACVPLAADRERVTVYELAPATAVQRFYTLRLTFEE